MSDTVCVNVAVSESLDKENGNEERVFTAEEMHFEGFDFVAPENLQVIETPNEAREADPKHGHDFAQLRRSLEDRNLRLNRSTSDLYTIEEMKPPICENRRSRGEVHMECAR